MFLKKVTPKKIKLHATGASKDHREIKGENEKNVPFFERTALHFFYKKEIVADVPQFFPSPGIRIA